jgi:hypothetical protein
MLRWSAQLQSALQTHVQSACCLVSIVSEVEHHPAALYTFPTCDP